MSFAYERADTLLKVDRLSVEYGPFTVLRDISFEIKDLKRPGMTQGQKVAVLAPSGTGKTQLFKRIAGLEKPTAGTVKIGVDQKPVQAGMVGVVPQNYLLFEHYTVMQTLMVAAGMCEKNPKAAQLKCNGLLDSFGLLDKKDCYPQQLSGGQRQRVSIAEQILSSNHFLLMDEPFSGLDIIKKRVVCNVIDAVAARDELNTIIFSTHDIESAVMVADTILLLGHQKTLPGATLIKTIDMIDCGLAWHENVDKEPAFAPMVAEIKALFPAL